MKLHQDEAGDSSITKFHSSFLANNLTDYEISTLQSVLVLRNPYQRVVSAWVDKIVIFPTKEIKLTLIPEFEYYLGKKSFLTATFEDFCSFLLHRGLEKTIDSHFSLQVPLIWRYKPSTIINLPNIDNGLHVFYKKLNNELLEKYLIEINSNRQPSNATPFNTRQEYIIKPFPASKLTVDQLYGLAQIGLLPPRSWFLSESVIACVNKIYKNDFLHFNFSRPNSIIKNGDTNNIEKILKKIWARRYPVFHRGDLPDDFCSICYNELNPDISKAGIDPIEHFIGAGMFEVHRKYKKTVNNDKNCIHHSSLNK